MCGQKALLKCILRRWALIAFLSTLFVILTLFSEIFATPLEVRVLTFSVSTICVGSILFHLYATSKRSAYTDKLGIARVHVLMHFVPFILLFSYFFGMSNLWFNFILIVLMFLFFFTGRMTWNTVGSLYPSNKLYRVFYYGNSAFMNSLPVIYVVTFIMPGIAGFDMIRNVALLYFSGHFAILGFSSLKIEADFLSGSTEHEVSEISP